MVIMSHAKFHFNGLMLSLIFGIRASKPPPPGPYERLKRPGLIGLKEEYNLRKNLHIIDLSKMDSM